MQYSVILKVSKFVRASHTYLYRTKRVTNVSILRFLEFIINVEFFIIHTHIHRYNIFFNLFIQISKSIQMVINDIYLFLSGGL